MKALLNTKEAADYIGYSEVSLRNSRMKNGALSGVEPPKHIEVGPKTIRYKLSDLNIWIEELGND